MFERFFFSIRVFFHRHWRFTEQQGKEADDLLHSFPPFPPAQEYLDIYVQLCIWNDNHLFLRHWPYVIDVVLVFLLLTSDIFHTFFYYFFWWPWRSKYQLGPFLFLWIHQEIYKKEHWHYKVRYWHIRLV